MTPDQSEPANNPAPGAPPPVREAIGEITLSRIDTQIIVLPAAAHIVAAVSRRGEPAVFYRYTRDRPTVAREITIVVANDDTPIGPSFRYIGTVILDNDDTVLHVFERRDYR